MRKILLFVSGVVLGVGACTKPQPFDPNSDMPGSSTTDMASSDLAGGGGACGVAQVVINEVQVEGAAPGGGAKEFIELYNRCDVEVPLMGVKLVYRNAGAGGANDTATFADFTTETIPAKGFYLVASNEYGGSPQKMWTSGSLADTSGVVGLRMGATVLDAAAYGTGKFDANNSLNVEMPPLAMMIGADMSMSRKPDGKDTNSNAADFTIGTPTPGMPNQ